MLARPALNIVEVQGPLSNHIYETNNVDNNSNVNNHKIPTSVIDSGDYGLALHRQLWHHPETPNCNKVSTGALVLGIGFGGILYL